MTLETQAQLAARYSGLAPAGQQAYRNPVVDLILGQRSARAFRPDPLPAGMLEWLIACAQSAPTKSDLQGMSVVSVESPDLRQALAALMPTQRGIREAPTFLVWCPDMRRNQEVCRLRGKEHRSNTLDMFLNAAVDTALCMQAFTLAAASLGLGTCHVSAVRVRIFEVGELLGLPSGVFPLAGTLVGYPAEEPRITPRLPQSAVLHRDRYDPSVLPDALRAHDEARRATHPYAPGSQVHRDRYPDDPDYGWMEHIARRLEQRERLDFRTYVQAQGFKLE